MTLYMNWRFCPGLMKKQIYDKAMRQVNGLGVQNGYDREGLQAVTPVKPRGAAAGESV